MLPHGSNMCCYWPKNNSWKEVDLGLVHSSAAPSLMELIVTRLRQDGDIEDGISPNFLARNWHSCETPDTRHKAHKKDGQDVNHNSLRRLTLCVEKGPVAMAGPLSCEINSACPGECSDIRFAWLS